jgi:hypothetical protein
MIGTIWRNQPARTISYSRPIFYTRFATRLIALRCSCSEAAAGSDHAKSFYMKDFLTLSKHL